MAGHHSRVAEAVEAAFHRTASHRTATGQARKLPRHSDTFSLQAEKSATQLPENLAGRLCHVRVRRKQLIQKWTRGLQRSGDCTFNKCRIGNCLRRCDRLHHRQASTMRFSPGSSATGVAANSTSIVELDRHINTAQQRFGGVDSLFVNA